MLRKHPKWGSRDRRTFASQVYDLVRWRRLAAWLADTTDGLAPAAPLTDSDIWAMWAAWQTDQTGTPPALPECTGITVESVAARRALTIPPAVERSLPDWLWDTGAEAHGPAWPALAAALNQPADVFLRVNTLRATAAELIAKLAAEDTPAEEISETCVRLASRKNLALSPAMKAGLMEVQDISSQRIAPLLQAEPGMLVVDGCAGAGGKTLHLATLMQNKGRIIAMDPHAAKLDELKRRAERCGVFIIRPETLTGPEVLQRRAGTADRLLLDVPCTGTGVLRRNPDTKWKLTPEALTVVLQTQQEILRTAPVMLKPGGKLVYATCSILPQENRAQIDWLLATQPGQWEIEEELTLLPLPCPDVPGIPGDGFYAVRLRKL